MNKNLPKRMSFYLNNKIKRNCECMDAGLFTQNLKPKTGELDMNFVTRYLISMFKGRKNCDPKIRKIFMTLEEGDDYISIWSVK